MKNHLHCTLLLCLFLFVFQHFTIANELYPVPLTQRVSHSTLIAEGKVIAQYSFQQSGNGNIYTSNLIQVYRAFKGSIQGEQIEIITEGGTVGRLKQVHSATLSLSIGETGLFFCIPTQRGINGRAAFSGNSYMVYSSMQGFIAYDDRTNTATDPFTRYTRIIDAGQTVRQLTGFEKQISERPAPVTIQLEGTMAPMVAPSISTVSPLNIPAGTDAILTITGNDFGAVQGTGYVSFRNANSANPASYVRPLASDYISWTNTQIQVKVPSTTIEGPSAGTGAIRVVNGSDPTVVTSTDVVVIPYAYSNLPDEDDPILPGQPTSEIPTHVNYAGTGGYTFQMETSFAANTAARNAFIRAMQTWTCNTRMNWVVGANTTVNTVAGDGTNVVMFDDAGSPLPAGVLGRCTSWYGGCGVSSPFVWVVAEIDVVFDNAPTSPWNFGPAASVAGQVDFESVAVHELGHGHQLNHIISPGAVMHFAIAAGTNSRVLGAGDIAGGNVVTARGFTNYGCVPPMTPGEVYALAGTAGGTQVCVNSTVSVSGTEYSDPSCNDIARILPSGASPVSGLINVCTKYESGIPSFNSAPYCERHYDIEPASNPSTSTGTITLYYSQAEFTAYNAANGAFPDLPTGAGDAAGIANLRITQYHGTSGTGIPGSYSGAREVINPTDANIVWSATRNRWEITFTVTGFSGFFVHTSSAALPLHLLQFSGTKSGNSNQLQWTTASEENTAYFEIQRSTDGIHFIAVGQVAATGTAAGNKTYQYTDDVINHGQPVYYYRLKMVDDNTQFTYSTIVILKRSNNDFLVKVLQNPFREQLQVAVTSPQLQECVVTLTDMNGRMVAQRTVVLQKGNTLINVPGVQRPGAGTYLLTLVTTSEKQVIKVLKQQ